MLEQVPARETRHFHVYKGPRLVMILEDRPGTLHSRAAPGPEGPPQHPFVHGIARDAASESELGRLLRESNSFDEYLGRLLVGGYDIVSSDDDADGERAGGRRIVDAEGAAGALWPQPGQFSALERQPAPGQLLFPLTLTVYRRELAERLLALLQDAADYETYCRTVTEQGFRVVDIDG